VQTQIPKQGLLDFMTAMRARIPDAAAICRPSTARGTKAAEKKERGKCVRRKMKNSSERVQNLAGVFRPAWANKCGRPKSKRRNSVS
jgi:hypothetical protein